MYFKAAVLEKKNKLKIHKLKLPTELLKGQILVKISYSSICHTQLQEIDMKRGKDLYLPHCIGHEGVGVVKKIYKGCKKFRSGDKVCLTWVKSKKTVSKGHFYTNDKKKIINSGPVHTLNEYAVIDESRIYRLKNFKNFKNQVLLGCAMPTSFNIFLENKIKKNSKICVFGGGGLGLSFIAIAKYLGYTNINLLEKNNIKRKNIGKKFAVKTFSSIKELNKDDFDVVVECTGNIKIFEQSLNYVKKFGGKVITVGNYKVGLNVKINPWNVIEGKTLKGVWNSDINFNNKFDKLQKVFNKISTNIFFSDRIYKLIDVNRAIKDFKKGKVIRPLIKMI